MSDATLLIVGGGVLLIVCTLLSAFFMWVALKANADNFSIAWQREGPSMVPPVVSLLWLTGLGCLIGGLIWALA